ncbi:ABC transporter permease [Salinibacterium sp. SWN1162]|uniref:ABC transporter permease n=1 Tax=Salinibacterium sp. SWN1162 TaxID=2792053 RepID=UPI0018CDD025|nr:ABC transporter permease [Salinibacterium sp. SWN1162]MBH0008684.1 ABC transporter permease [Salinibacterium sp. SWN1162]
MSESVPPGVGTGMDYEETIDERPMRMLEVWRSLKRDPAALGSLMLLVLVIVVAVLSPFISPHDPLQTFNDIGLGPLGQPLPPGTPGFLLGTDALGRDVLSRLISGTQVSLVIGIVANGLATLVGVLVGVIAGYFGGIIEAILMRITDVVISFPILLLCTALIAVTTRSTTNVIIVIALIYWTTLARIIRGMVISLKQREFVIATRTLGVGHLKIMWKHIIPHLLPAIIVYATLGIAASILIESALSFLGIGVPIPQASWGQMISDGSTYFQIAPWMLFFPGACLIVTVMAFNLLGDWLSELLNSSAPMAR